MSRILRGRVAQRVSACLTNKRLLVRIQPRPLRRRIAQAAERLSDTEEAPVRLRLRPSRGRSSGGRAPVRNAGRSRFDSCRPHHGSVAQHGRAPGSYPGRCRFDACRGHHGRTATGAVSRLENGWASRPWGFESLSFRFARFARDRRAPRASPRAVLSARGSGQSELVSSGGGPRPRMSGAAARGRRSFIPAWSIRHDARPLPARGRFESCRRSSVAVCPRGRTRLKTPGPQPGSCGFESRRGCSIDDWS